MRRIYLDNAATSWPKPEAVLAAIEDYHRRLGAPAGRGVYREAIETERLIADARRRVAELIGVNQPQRVVFTAGCTDALNQAIHGIVRPGDHVVSTRTEHNSVLRPLSTLALDGDIACTLVDCDGKGFLNPDDIERAIVSNTRLIVLNHVSNVTGVIQPAEAIGRIAAEHQVPLLLDAAQSIGHLPVNAAKLNASLIAMPGHKGLLGPLGIGALYIAPGLEEHVSPLRQGGTGTHSEEPWQPQSLPDRYESGTHNVPGILGLAAGVAHVQQMGPVAILKHIHALTSQLLAGLCEIDGVTIHGPNDPDKQLGVVSITLRGYDPHEAAATLDAAYRIQARPGIHCAPNMHQALGTLASGGTLRFSVSLFNTADDIDAAVRAVQEIAASAIV